MRPITFLSLVILTTPVLAGRFRPRVPWGSDVRFVYDNEVSDNFQDSELDLNKWDPHGVRVPETGCPRWNGPPSSAYPDYSTYFPTTTDPVTGEPTVKQYRIGRGKLFLKMDEKPLEFFTAREYYCNATTFKCNHDESIDCFATDAFGNPKYADSAKTFIGIVHDKCKKEPFCIPHPDYVTGKPRVYSKFVGAHLTGKRSFKYGYFEVSVKVGLSPAVAAAWMHDDHMVNGFCRLRRNPNTEISAPILECPSRIRSRRWQEIDILEAMNSQIHKRRYIPNIHAFSGYKGEFTSASALDNGDGNVGGGPIIVEANVFNLKRPSFSDLPKELQIGNDYHYNPGPVFELDRDWARKKRTVGMYWSPNEIRYLIDGQEVRRVKNNLIHQPMFLDLSYALNVGWAQEFPTKRHIRREVKFFHFRRWQVFTADGEDPPSDLPLDTDQDHDFMDLYGTKLGGVHGRFPANDNETVLETNTNTGDTMNSSLTGGMSIREWSSRMGSDKRVAALVERGFRPAGGEGNVRFSGEVVEMTRRRRRVAESREDRMAIVRNGEAEMLEDGATTAYEFTNPNGDQAGWSTAGRVVGSDEDGS